jgi:enoyl-CoA hydratase
MSDILGYEQHGPVAWITLNRPDKLNALNQALVQALDNALKRAESDDSVKVVVLRGAGRGFSSGYDLSEEAGAEIDGAAPWHDALNAAVAVTMRLWALTKPTIAAVHGWCLAGGLDLAMACDLIVAADDVRVGEPEIRYGSGPVTLLMPFLIGQKKTNELLFTGDVIDANEAERIGLINRVVPIADLTDTVAKLATRIAPTPLPVLRFTKIALTRAYEAMGLRTAVNANLDISAILNSAETPEQREFDDIVRKEGLKAALAWRDGRYGGELGPAR